MDRKLSKWWLLGLTLTTICLWVCMGYDGFYGQDSYGYALHARGWQEFILGGGKPQMHPSQPYLFPALAGLIATITFIPVSSVLQFISMGGLIIGSLLLVKVLKLKYHLKESDSVIFVLIGFSLTPYLVRQSFLAMSDMACVTALIISIYLALKYFENGQAKFAILAIAAGAFATMLRYGAGMLIFPLCAIVFMKLCSSRKIIAASLSLISVGVLIYPQLWVHSDDLWALSNHSMFQGWSIKNAFLKEHCLSAGGCYQFDYPNVLFSLGMIIHPGLFVIGLVCLPFIKRPTFDFLSWRSMLSIGLCIYLLVNVGIPFQNKRFFIICVPFLLILMAPAYDRFYQWFSSSLKPFLRVVLLSSFVVAQGVMTYIVMSKIIRVNAIEQEIAEYVEEMESCRIYTFGLDLPLSHYSPKHEYITMYRRPNLDIRSGEFVLFNQEKILKNWSEKAPGILWRRLESEHRLNQRWTHHSGWKLYEVK